MESYYLQARALGLLPDSPAPEVGWLLDKYILELQKVPNTVRTMDIPDIREGTSEAAVTELTRLINEEDQLGQEIGSIRRRLGKLDQLSSSVGEYGTTLTSQQDRLQGVRLVVAKRRKCATRMNAPFALPFTRRPILVWPSCKRWRAN